MKPEWLNVPAVPIPRQFITRARIITVDRTAALALHEWQRHYFDCDIERLHHPIQTRHCDKHGIDVALSAGRHAVERAKLSQRNTLITGLFSELTLNINLAHSPRIHEESYQFLCACQNPQFATLIGVMIASAQLGLNVQLCGLSKALVRHLSACLLTTSLTR